MDRRGFLKGCAALLAGMGIGHGCAALKARADDVEEFPDAEDDPEVEPEEGGADDPDEPDEGPETVWNGVPIRFSESVPEGSMFIVTNVDQVRKIVSVRGIKP